MSPLPVMMEKARIIRRETVKLYFTDVTLVCDDGEDKNNYEREGKALLY